MHESFACELNNSHWTNPARCAKVVALTTLGCVFPRPDMEVTMRTGGGVRTFDVRDTGSARGIGRVPMRAMGVPDPMTLIERAR